MSWQHKLILFVLMFVASSTSEAASAEGRRGYFTIPVPHLREATSAVGQAISISGRCFHEHITLIVRHLRPDRTSVVVRINDKTKHFNESEPFVRDLFGDLVMFQHFIVCSGTGFELTSWGASLADEKAATFVLGQTFFDPQGRVTAYDLSPQTYSFIQGHLR